MTLIHKTVASAEIDEAAVGPRRGTVLALRDADSLKRGETMPRGPRRCRRARFLTTGKGLIEVHAFRRSIEFDATFFLRESNQDQPSEGLFTEGSFALLEGDYTDNATLSVIAVGHPPCESRETAR